MRTSRCGISTISRSCPLWCDPAFVSEVLANPRCRNYGWLVTNSNLSRVAGEPAFAELPRSLYVQWLKDVEFFGKTLPAPPPELPDPKSLIPTPLPATAAR